MRRLTRIFGITILLAGVVVPVHAAQPRMLDYRVELHFGWPLSGKLSERMRMLADGTWQVERKGLVFGFTTNEISKFKIQGSEVQSVWYHKNMAGVPGDTRVEIVFPEDTRDVYDPISLAFKIGSDLRADPTITKATYRLAEKPGEIRDISFIFYRNQVIDSDLGKVRTVRVDQETEAEVERTYWLATDVEYIIIRAIERDEDGDITSEINIRQGSVGSKPITQ